MANNVTGFGFVVSIIASVTFPTGFTFTQASDDADPLDFASIKIGDAQMGVNGDIIIYNKAVPLPMVVNVIPGSVDDINLQTLANANRAVQGKQITNDVITVTIVYPDKTTHIFSNGVITDAQFSSSISGAGRLKTKQYSFLFQSFS